MQQRRRQWGIIDPRLYVYGGLVLAIAAGGGYLTYRWMSDGLHTAQREAQDAKASLKAQESLTKLFEGDLNEATAAVEEKGVRLAAQQRTNQGLTALLDHVQRGEGASASDTAYLGGAVPPSVRRVRRIGAGCAPDLSVPCTGKLDARNPSPGNGGRNNAGDGGGSGEASLGAASVQR